MIRWVATLGGVSYMWLTVPSYSSYLVCLLNLFSFLGLDDLISAIGLSILAK